MEVDDAAQVLAASGEGKSEMTLLEDGAEKNCHNEITARRSGRRLIKSIQQMEQTELMEDVVAEAVAVKSLAAATDESDGGNESVFTATPFKLEVSATDEDDDELEAEASRDSDYGMHKRSKYALQNNGKSSPRRQLLQSPHSDSGSSACGGGGDSLKRKRFTLRRSGSDEYLLGFDEHSGNAKLVKHDPAEQQVKPVESPEITNVSSANEELLQSLTLSPQATKKIKRSPSETEEVSPKASPRSHATPTTTPPHKVEVVTPPKQEEPPVRQHIVADNEDSEFAPLISGTEISAAAAPGTPIPVSTKKPLSAKDDYYKKPFEYGWKRELVYRANMETSKDKADVYFITPGGKKLRTRSDIAPLLEGELTLDHFSFAREPLGVGPELETVRSAKPSHRASMAAATLVATAPAPSHPGKRISKPKGPKGASPPPQGWTPTRALKTNNAALLSSAGSSKYSGSNPSTPPSSRGLSSSSKSSKTKKPLHGAAEAANATSNSNNINNNLPTAASHEPCTMMCTKARGQIPQLQCVKCLCLYHHECVGLSRQSSEYRVVGDTATKTATKDYVCESCVPSTAAATAAATTPTPVATAAAPAAAAAAQVSPAVAKPKHSSSNKPLMLESVRVQRLNKLPQTIAVVKGKKYVMVAKPLAPPAPPARAAIAASAEHINDIENDLKQINESIRNSRKQSSTSLDAAFQPNNMELAPPKSFATNFFANVSFAYDALLCILKYLKIHERPRAASVCKLWHLAAKDTSLWQTVRMKNSKISDWAGFAAALRRGETKHLDLRKMLFSNTKGDEMWSNFSTYIGTVFSLESIDLCRCSTKVVESLFLSNPQLRVLNALAINDESFSLENIDKLIHLKELRLRPCEPGTLDGDLLSLQTLTNLAHLSLTSLLGLGTKSIEVLGELVNLRSLELGECGDFDSSFAQAVLPKLANLQRLRLENGQKTSCCTLEILDAVAKLEQLTQLEFVNFDIKPGFDEKLMLCTNIAKLLIIPTYISQSATTNQIVLYAVQQIADTLKVFTWGVTVELLRVTALYVDQCEESTKKEKHHFDECIPVMKPVPGAPPSDSQEEEVEDHGPNAVPQIEILPLDKVESILGDNLVNTKFTIVKVPYQATCKQHLVE